MQEKHLNVLADKAFIDHIQKPKTIESQMKKMAKLNDEALSSILPDYERTPTAEELTVMRQYGIDYKKANKRASKREVRRAIQKKFNIRIYK